MHWTPKTFYWNFYDQYEDFWLFRKGMQSWYKLQCITDAEGGDTHLEYLLNFLGLVGQKKHKLKFVTRWRQVPQNS